MNKDIDTNVKEEVFMSIQPLDEVRMRQVEAYIRESPIITSERARATMLFALDQSENLSRPVVVMALNDPELGEELFAGAHNINTDWAAKKYQAEMWGDFAKRLGLKMWFQGFGRQGFIITPNLISYPPLEECRVFYIKGKEELPPPYVRICTMQEIMEAVCSN